MMRDVPQRRATDRPWRAPFSAVAVVSLSIVLTLLAAVVAGRATAPRFSVRDAEATPIPRVLPIGVQRFHDAQEGVTCWRVEGSGGISCLPDQWLASAQLQETE